VKGRGHPAVCLQFMRVWRKQKTEEPKKIPVLAHEPEIRKIRPIHPFCWFSVNKSDLNDF